MFHSASLGGNRKGEAEKRISKKFRGGSDMERLNLLKKETESFVWVRLQESFSRKKTGAPRSELLGMHRDAGHGNS